MGRLQALEPAARGPEPVAADLDLRPHLAVRHTLGAVYLSAGRYADAERAYREDLAEWPNNGWSLFGLSRALELRGKTDETARVREQYRREWARADEPLETSCKCIPKT